MKEQTVKEMNMRVQSDYLYFLDTCCHLHHRSRENTDNLYRCFKQCLKRIGLFEYHISQHEFEAMLQYSGLIKSYETGFSSWEGISLNDHEIQATYNYFEFPQIYIEKVEKNPDISNNQ